MSSNKPLIVEISVIILEALAILYFFVGPRGTTSSIPAYILVATILVGLISSLVCTSIGIYQHQKHHDKTALATMLVGVGILLFPILIAMLFFIILGTGLSRNPF